MGYCNSDIKGGNWSESGSTSLMGPDVISLLKNYPSLPERLDFPVIA